MVLSSQICKEEARTNLSDDIRDILKESSPSQLKDTKRYINKYYHEEWATKDSRSSVNDALVTQQQLCHRHN